MRSIALTILFFWVLFTLAGCRCERHIASSLTRTDTTALDVRFRYLTELRDTLAERQTIRIEYYYPYFTDLENTTMGKTAGTGSLPPSDDVGGPKPSGTVGGLPAIKSIEIETEHHSGSTQSFETDSTKVSRSSSKETQQKEKDVETRMDNTTVAIVWIVSSVLVLVLVLLLFSMLQKKLKR